MTEATLAWSGRASWAVLETAFEDGHGFLHQWANWLEDPQRPARLHHVALTPDPPSLASLQWLVASSAVLATLKSEIAALEPVWCGFLPGLHRLALSSEKVILSLLVLAPAQSAREALRSLAMAADEVWLGDAGELDGENGIAQTVAPLCRQGTCIRARKPAPDDGKSLWTEFQKLGFVKPDTEPHDDLAQPVVARYAPHWTPRRGTRDQEPVKTPSHAVVIGGGLAGASSAFSLARRGWRVTVLDRNDQPAGGASGLPAGLIAPHVSMDDRDLSRLTRAGVRATLQRAQALLTDGVDWQRSGVLEHRVKDSRELPEAWHCDNSPGREWSRPATQEQLARASLDAKDPAHWHAMAGWMRPAALVNAMLAQASITWLGGQNVKGLRARAGEAVSTATGHPRWDVLGSDMQALAEADIVVVAAGYDSLALVSSLGEAPLPLNPLRGQVAWGSMPDADDPQDGALSRLPPFPVNGLGSFIGGVQIEGRPAWIAGSTFERGCTEALIRVEDTATNQIKLQTLLPAVASGLAPQFDAGQVRAWAGVRCTSPDRLPAVGALDPHQLPGLLLCTAMGARGLTLAVLCGELIAAQLHGEPLPLTQKQAKALSPQRWKPDTASKLGRNPAS